MIVIKVIQNNFNQSELNKKEGMPLTVHTFCDYCDSELEVSKEDTHIGWLGAAYVTCPCCKRETMVDELDGITLTKANVEFPVHFRRTNKDMDGVIEIDKYKITEDVRKGLDYLKNNKDDPYWFTCRGDSFVKVFRNEEDDEYVVFVAKDFYLTEIEFQEEDYSDDDDYDYDLFDD